MEASDCDAPLPVLTSPSFDTTDEGVGDGGDPVMALDFTHSNDENDAGASADLDLVSKHGIKRNRTSSFDSQGGDISDSAKLQRSRERNREHARRTRLRKKAQLQALKVKVAGLQSEQHRLEEGLEDCVTAKLLLALSTCRAHTSHHATAAAAAELNNHAPLNPHPCQQPPPVSGDFMDHPTKIRKTGLGAARSPAGQSVALVKDPVTQQLRMQQNVQLETVVGAAALKPDSSDEGEGKPDLASAEDDVVPMRGTINWKAGFTLESDGTQRKLSPDELERLRRERNRLHAKMTRNRKKVYVANVEHAIAELEDTNASLRARLQAEHGFLLRRFPTLIPGTLCNQPRPTRVLPKHHELLSAQTGNMPAGPQTPPGHVHPVC